MRDLTRLLKPKSIAVIGGGAWCASIISAAKQIGFDGALHPVHPTGKQIAGHKSLRSLEEVPGPIDAAFIGVNRHATLDVVAQLRRLKAGGAICFASGFSEAAAEDAAAQDLQAALIEAAGEMPILGPNCYGFVNAFDGCAIWPDQHGCSRVQRGVAILTQSSNIAINLTMQNRGLPIGYMLTCGNQAQTAQTDIALQLLDDERVTAIGLHIEGFGNLRGWEALAQKARTKGVTLIALKSGVSQQAQAAAVSHTASLTGSDTGADAFLQRLGIRRARSLPVFLESLKLAHQFGPLSSNRIASISCSGGEAALAADTAQGTGLIFPPLNPRQAKDLSAALGPMVAMANPLDYHTYIWRDQAAMTQAWAAMADDEIAMTLLVSDYPRADLCDASDWECVTQAAIEATRRTGRPYAVVASLAELLPEQTAKTLMDHGVGAIHGLDHGLEALDVMSRPMAPPAEPVLLPGIDRDAELVDEQSAKLALAAHGLTVPPSVVVTDRCTAGQAAADIGFPVALKTLGLAHKTGANGLALGLNTRAEVEIAAPRLADGPLLVERMVAGTLVEVLVGVTRDPAHGFVLTLGAGGTMTDVLRDRASLLIPATRTEVTARLKDLNIAPLLEGFRGNPPVDLDALLAAIDAVQAYVLANAERVEEVEINPLICTQDNAIAADALIRKAQ
ncbi:MAG: acetate--CoA ligase family protein [Rhodobacteraceae bacterium]|jgi:acyl-CoA synthetase (NDP forming)|nr:acetate--CoA ligase family protein [Paracoccaceae bacterium]MBT7343715.1 acetate--CoA ligase family protein [Paracoccaceae bacterium]